MNINLKYAKLVKTHNNNILISNMNLSDKYTNFENSRLNESETLLYEINVKPDRFKRYTRGQVVKVKFGVNIGSEFSGDHYAIVISKKDTMLNPVLHVIPLTSKCHNYNIYLGNLLYVKEEIEQLEELERQQNDLCQIKKIKKCINYYKSKKNTISYACIKHLKTVSKLSICRMINEFDYLCRINVSSAVLDIIDQEIIKEYTLLK